jgi:hypothetical protein
VRQRICRRQPVDSDHLAARIYAFGEFGAAVAKNTAKREAMRPQPPTSIPGVLAREFA